MHPNSGNTQRSYSQGRYDIGNEPEYYVATPIPNDEDEGRSNRNKGAKRDSSAMSSEEFEQLCKSIEENVAKITRAVGTGIGQAGSAMGDAIGKAVGSFQQNYNEQKTTRSSSQASNNRMNNARSQAYTEARLQKLAARQAQYAYNAKMKQRFRSTAPMKVGGAFMTGIGAMLTFVFGGATLAGFAELSTGLMGTSFVMDVAALGACGVLTLASGWMTLSGVRRIQIANIAQHFRRAFGDREVCTINELAVQTQTTPAKALSNAQKVIKRNLLPQGRLDNEGTCLMVTEDAYTLYRQMQQNKRAAKARMSCSDAATKQRPANEKQPLSPEARAFIDQGYDYIKQLRNLDSAIDDEAVSAHIVEIEQLVDRILKRVESKPDVLSSLDRLMDYYLPTTIRLLVAYDDLEEQPVQGNNIATSRREIEQTLSVLTTAFEKLLDETYMDVSLDVSADISVLNAMLAQEGLTENPFDKNEGRSE